ncbi:CRP/FNR family transcriptional regulator, anaerobic regulatory protein [Carnobacterium iners]|uniref:CRP/FNR family transcriptional regulator, anaerobic regulatory protein n=1 Tax=Carnobacterium iners TaxID=1073423 RepID=A0A1X7MX78_9LACT|nr:Crp/Fnr family transcriptional regulator [Carnobacterium iners]SEK17997.1 CRP/FNR family transcriptional regulator, anaerobic regulatory protein [Carnobacterium iners]SMH29376.1 CRP/FNR family transcriptional regulator, anaerobic regulatory protein [Carnobacterium iners]
MKKNQSTPHGCEGREQFCLSNVPLFQSLTTEQMKKIYLLIHHKYYSQGETIYRPFETADSLYMLKSGKVRIYRLSDTGKEQLIRMVDQNEFTGELALFKKGIYEAFAQALTDCCVCAIKHEDFRELLLQYPKISIEMLSTISQRLGASEQQTTWATTETVRDRLLHFLISLVDSTQEEPIVELKMAKKDLASYLGTTSESLSRELARLEKDNIIKKVACGKIKLLALS